MNRSAGRRAAWYVMVTMALLGALFAWPMSAEAQNPFIIIPVVVETVVGAILARRRPDNPIGWVFLGVGSVTGILVVAVVLADWGASTPDQLPWWALIAAWLGGWIWYPLVYLLTIPTLLLFPSGLASPRWRIVLGLPLVALVGAIFVAATVPMLTVTFDEAGNAVRQVENPLSPGFMSGIAQPEDTVAFKFLGMVFLGCLIASVVGAGLRVKRSRGVERLQMRWFGFAVALFIPLIVIEVLFSAQNGQRWMQLVEAAVISAVPAACGVAILRYRLYEIDRIISRTTSYAIVTGILLAGYAVVVTAVSGLLPESGSLAVAAATLVTAAAFRPVLRRVRRMVDRHFDREHYDAEIAVGDFADRLRGANEVASVADDLDAVVQQVFQPSSTAVWVRLAVEPDVGRHGH